MFLVMEKKELWYEMLTTYRNMMCYRNGITLPNMIGAYYLYDNSINLSSSQCIVRLLKDILTSSKDINVLISKCGNINNYVLSVLNEKPNPQHPNISNRIFVNMYDSNLKTHLSGVDELGEYLYSIYLKEISSKRFSVTDGVWNHFSDIEIKCINDIIKSL